LNGKRIFLIIIIVLSITSISLVNAATEVLTVPAGVKNTRTLYLDNGDKLSGSISVSGGSGNDINFQIQDPSGVIITSYSRTTSTSFSFNADKAGTYTMIFDNSFSLITSKRVTLSTNIEKPMIPGTNAGGIPGFPLESLILGSIVGVSILLFWGRNHIGKK